MLDSDEKLQKDLELIKQKLYIGSWIKWGQVGGQVRG
jgi:hypothetical protein